MRIPRLLVAAAVVVLLAGAEVATAATATAAKPVIEITSVTISGDAIVGSGLTADATSNPVALYKWRWYRGSKPIRGAVKQMYVPTAADVAHHLRVRVTASSFGYTSASKFSSATLFVEKGTFLSTPVSFTGINRVGTNFTADVTTNPTAKLSYAWFRDGKKIKNATKKTIRLVAADLNKTLSVAIHESKAGFTTNVVTGTAASPTAVGTLAAGTPTITGKQKVGSTIVGHPGKWTSGTKLQYLWKFGPGAASTSKDKTRLHITNAMKGYPVYWYVLGQKSGYTPVQVHTQTVVIP